MGVRVRVRIEFSGSSTDSVALVNTGYETDVPEILIPPWTAERLGLWPRLPSGAMIESYRTASGVMSVYRVGGAKIYLLAEDLIIGPVDSYIVIAEHADEILISDQLASALGIAIEDPARGLWRLRGETKIRESVSV